jgi:hypothetical protein
MLEDDWSQHRIKRRHNLIGKLRAGVKYVLDLTPPEEGEQALALTSELSCPEGFLLWHHAANRVGISTNLVGGRDESVIRPDLLEHLENGQSPQSKAVAAVLGATDGLVENVLLTPNPERKSIDYDPVRHRTGIERLLQIIEGKDPRLNSAPKIWTLAVLSEHFDCKSVVVSLIFLLTSDSFR